MATEPESPPVKVSHKRKDVGLSDGFAERMAAARQKEIEDRKIQLKLKQDAMREMQRIEDELKKLPANASPAAELDWVKSHPLIMHRSAGLISGDVQITPTDIRDDGRHATAPSRYAVTMLIHWLKHIDEFHKMVMSETKKQVGKDARGSAKDGDVELEMSEVERLLKEVTSADV